MPDWKRHIRRRLEPLRLPPDRESEITEELVLHLDERYAEALAAGISPEEAQHGALAELAAGGRLSRALRHVEPSAPRLEPVVPGRERRESRMAGVAQDLRYASRMLRGNPGFTTVAVLTLALGIGANTAIFSVVNAVLLRPLPFADPGRLVVVHGHDRRVDDRHAYLSFDDLEDYRGASHSFEELAGYSPQWSLNLSIDGEAERVTGIWASAGLLRTLGVTPIRGREFTTMEDRSGAAGVALISYALWQRRFAGADDAVGRRITLDDEAVTIVGVLPPGFRWLEDGDLWLPLALNPVARRGRAVRAFAYLGRLRHGVPLERAQADLETIAAGLAARYPDSNTGMSASVVPLREEITGTIRPHLLALAGAVGLVLLIACVNVANLFLARGRGRAREIAVRLSLGASRPRLVAQLLTESVLLSAIAGAAGILLAWVALRVMVTASPVPIPRQNAIGLDAAVLTFALLLSVLTGVLFGLAPALRGVRADLTDALKEGGHASAGRAHRRTLGVLVVAEVALSLVVVTSAGLLVRSFAALQAVDPGFSTRHVLSFDLPLTAQYRDPNVRLAFYQRLYSAIEALPGVVAVGDVTRLPLAGRGGNITTVLAIEGAPVPPGERPEIDFRRAGHDYFRVLGIPLVDGRLFDGTDTPTSEPVALINESAARRFFHGGSPLGRHIGLGGDATPRWNTIVGVVGDVHHVGLQVEPRPEVYVATSQAAPYAPVVVVRTTGDPAASAPAIRGAIRRLDPEIPIANLLTLAQIRDAALAQPRDLVVLFGLFGTLALLLAIVGVYGVMAYSVSQRVHEIGIRMALGARRTDVLRLLVGEGMALVAVGIALGIPAALEATRLLQALLFRVTPADAPTYAGVAGLLATAALLACWLPARRATRIDPTVALRCE